MNWADDLLKAVLEHSGILIPLILTIIGSIYKLGMDFQFRKIKVCNKMMSFVDSNSTESESLKQFRNELVSGAFFGKKELSATFAAEIHKIYQQGTFTNSDMRVLMPYSELTNNQLVMKPPKFTLDIGFPLVFAFIVSLYLVPVGSLLMISFSPENLLAPFAGLIILMLWGIYYRWALKPYSDYKRAKIIKPKLDKILTEFYKPEEQSS